MKRVFTASMHHESNSFNPIIAGESEFSVIRGAEIFNRFKENDAATGIIKTLLAAGYEVVPSVFTSAVPNGEVDIDFYNKIKKRLSKPLLRKTKGSRLMRRHLHCTAQCIFTVWAMRRAFFWRSFAPRCGNSDFLFARHTYNNDAAYAR